MQILDTFIWDGCQQRTITCRPAPGGRIAYFNKITTTTFCGRHRVAYSLQHHTFLVATVTAIMASPALTKGHQTPSGLLTQLSDETVARTSMASEVFKSVWPVPPDPMNGSKRMLDPRAISAHGSRSMHSKCHLGNRIQTIPMNAEACLTIIQSLTRPTLRWSTERRGCRLSQAWPGMKYKCMFWCRSRSETGPA